MKKIIGYILIICSFWTCDDLIEVDDVSSKEVQLLAPTDNATLNAGTLTFTWNPVEGADWYHFQIAQPSFEEALQIVRDTVIGKLNFKDSLSTDTYQWRVRAGNSAYNSEYTTNILIVEE